MIYLGNLAGLAVMIFGALWLSEMRAELIQAKIDSLRVQGEVIADVLAETATIGDPRPALLDQRAQGVLARLAPPNTVRVRLFQTDGDLVADTNLLTDRVEQLPLKGGKDQRTDLLSRRLMPWAEDISLAEEIARAAAGETASGKRREGQERVVSVSIPIQRVKAVVGVLTVEAADVDAILVKERQAMVPFFLGAALITFASSSLLAMTIGAPLRRLSEAADSLRRTRATRLFLPDVRKRKDEIGDLAKALERMTGALAERIDSNERFAADVAHELKNPLTSIRSAVETIQNVQDVDTRARLLKVIAADVGRMDRLITDIARATRLEAETARSAVDRVDLGRLLSDIAETYGMTRGEGEPRVSFTGPTGAAMVAGQADPLGQVFRNLIDNAKGFSPKGGVVDIRLELVRRRGERFWRASVSDQGPGIPEEHLESIFRRFYTDRPRGAAFGANSGLGLSIARQIVEAHKGRVWAENIDGVRPGQRLGARLIVELPMADEVRPGQEAAARRA